MVEPAHDYTRSYYGQSRRVVNQRTKVMLNAAASLYGASILLTQGSYNRGGVAASAGTHDGGGVVDIAVGQNHADRLRLVQCLRRVGFFAWLRTPAQGFGYHIHAVAIGDRELSSGARAQVVQGFQDRNGLAGRGPDPDADPYPEWVDRYGRHSSLDRPTPPKPKGYEPFPGGQFFKDEPKSPIITRMGKRLVAEGCGSYEDGPGPQWTDVDKASYARWQRKCGFSGPDANGWPGKSSWDKLKVPKG